MTYDNTIKGKFISRPNRFIANVEVDGEIQVCHVKNTGRCKELLVENAEVILEISDNPDRKTKYDLVAVYKNGKLINMDSQAPNKAAYDWLARGNGIKGITELKREKTFGNSRFDIYFEAEGKKGFMEVKGVTLEDDGIVKFPDAPTERGVKHIYELAEAYKQGFDAYILFVVQMKDVKYFQPNEETHKEFADALKYAKKEGVKVLAFDCTVTENSLDINQEVQIRL